MNVVCLSVPARTYSAVIVFAVHTPGVFSDVGDVSSRLQVLLEAGPQELGPGQVWTGLLHQVSAGQFIQMWAFYGDFWSNKKNTTRLTAG